MGRSKKFDYQAIIENSLIAHPDGLTLDELLEQSGLNVDRSTVFRHLTHLIEQGRAERIGNARASRYRPPGVAGIREDLVLPYTQRPAVEDVRPAENYQQVRAEPDSVPVLAPEYDAVVKKAVRTIVREWKRCNRVNLQIYLSLLAKPEHLDGLAAAVEKELAGLHERNLVKFGLSQADFRDFIPSGSPEIAGK